jgi:hypothetical protein
MLTSPPQPSPTHRFKMRRTMTSVYALALLALVCTAGAAGVANVKATVNKAMGRMKQVSVKTTDTRRSLVMTSATSSYTAPDKCSDQTTAALTWGTACGMTTEDDLEGVDNVLFKICDTTSYTCRDAFMKYNMDYPSYENGDVCEECRHHDDCDGDSYCFNGDCYAPGCTSDSECKTSNDGGSATCDQASSKCYGDDLDELDLNKDADLMTDELMSSTCAMLYPNYTYTRSRILQLSSSAALAPPLMLLMTATLLSVATGALLV